ncbi:MAG: AAA family ATPase [Candidatus Aenigmatarchaeota archaeon]
MITKLRLKNWKSHEDSELEFSAGTNGLVGIVGSGKTSILDAICFALFGTFPKLQLKKLRIEDTIMKKPSVKASAEVELAFELDGKKFGVKRTIERDKGTGYCEFKEDGRIVESPSTKSVTAAVERALKVNYELFSKAIYSEQNSIDYFLTLGRGQRMAKIDELLMIDRFEEARANAVKLANRLIERKLAKQSAADRVNVAEADKQIEELAKAISDFDMQRAMFRNELAEIQRSKLASESEAAELRKVREQMEKAKRDHAAVEASMRTTMESVERMERALKEFCEGVGKPEAGLKAEDTAAITAAVENYAKHISEMNDFLHIKQAECDMAQRELSKSKASIDFLRDEKIARLENEFEEKLAAKSDLERLRDRTGGNVPEQLKENAARLRLLVEELAAAKARISDLQKQMEELSKLEGVCPLCGSGLSTERKKAIVAEKTAEVDALIGKVRKAADEKIAAEERLQQLEAAAKKLDELLKEIADLDAVNEDLAKSKHILAEQSESMEKISAQFEALAEEIGIVRKELDAANTEKQRLEIIAAQMKDYGRQRQRIAELQSERDRMKAAVDEMEERTPVGRLEETERALRTLAAKEREIETRIISAEQLAKEKQARMDEYRRAVEAARKERDEVARLERLAADLKVFAEALKQTQTGLRKEFVEAVNYTMNRLWQTLYPYEDFVGIRLGIEEGDYVLQLQERSLGWVNVEGVASGGERSIACLAMRIAFALVLVPHLRMLVLDEPTANLDSNSVKVLSSTLKENIAEFIDQCFVITHDDAFEDAITGNLYRLERDKAKDEATRVVAL